MSLATRCPACGTVFRVVKDQLRVSEGWVRCGRCSEVFNAVEQLVEVPVPAPAVPSAPAVPTASSRVASSPLAGPVSDEPDEPGGAEHGSLAFTASAGTAASAERGPAGDLEDDFAPTRHVDPWSARGEPRPGLEDAVPETVSSSHSIHIEIDDDERRPISDASPTGAAHRAPAADVAGRSDVRADTATETATPAPWNDAPAAAVSFSAVAAAASDAEPADSPSATPSFLRESPAAQPLRPAVRRGLWALTLLAALVLAGQLLFEYRHWTAARWPALAPALQAACASLGCRVEAPRWIEAVVVESSGLVRVEGSSNYRFNAVMRNRAAMALAMPALDLTLTDARGEVIARRVLAASDLGATAASVAPGAEVPLQGLLTVATPPGTAVVGYTIEFFYP